jgi:hypothetical protein
MSFKIDFNLKTISTWSLLLLLLLLLVLKLELIVEFWRREFCWCKNLTLLFVSLLISSELTLVLLLVSSIVCSLLKSKILNINVFMTGRLKRNTRVSFVSFGGLILLPSLFCMPDSVRFDNETFRRSLVNNGDFMLKKFLKNDFCVEFKVELWRWWWLLRPRK